MRHKIISSPLVASVMLGSSIELTVGTGCQRDIQQECVPIDPSLDYEGPVQRKPYCHWDPGEVPEPPEGYAKTFRVFTSFEPSDGEPCDPCDAERFEALLQAKVAETCSSLDYTGLSVACYIPPEKDGDSCWVAGIYFSNFDQVPFDAGCHRCLPGSTLCDGPIEM